MERSSWTDERLDDFRRNVDTRFDGVDVRFDQVDDRFDRVDARFDRVEADLRDLRKVMHDGFDGMRLIMLRASGGIMLGLLAMIGTLLAQG